MYFFCVFLFLIWKFSMSLHSHVPKRPLDNVCSYYLSSNKRTNLVVMYVVLSIIVILLLINVFHTKCIRNKIIINLPLRWSNLPPPFVFVKMYCCDFMVYFLYHQDFTPFLYLTFLNFFVLYFLKLNAQAPHFFSH